VAGFVNFAHAALTDPAKNLVRTDLAWRYEHRPTLSGQTARGLEKMTKPGLRIPMAFGIDPLAGAFEVDSVEFRQRSGEIVGGRIEVRKLLLAFRADFEMAADRLEPIARQVAMRESRQFISGGTKRRFVHGCGKIRSVSSEKKSDANTSSDFIGRS
jgi:hypothetical protein